MDTFNRQIDLGIPSGGHIHMIGIGGASMSGLATLLLQMGYHITGSNNVEEEKLNQLREKGIHVYVGHAAEHVRGADLEVLICAAAKRFSARCAWQCPGASMRRTHWQRSRRRM